MKKTVLVETEAEESTSDNISDSDYEAPVDEEESETTEVSRLQPKEIEDYVNSLKDMAKYWYDTCFPFESVNLTEAEQKRVDRLNRIGIGHFRPLITSIISRKDIHSYSRVRIFDAIERVIFIAFRMGNFNASYGSNDYYRAARQVYFKELNADELCREIYDRTTNDIDYAVQNFVTRIEEMRMSSIRKSSLKYLNGSLNTSTGSLRYCPWRENISA